MPGPRELRQEDGKNVVSKPKQQPNTMFGFLIYSLKQVGRGLRGGCSSSRICPKAFFRPWHPSSSVLWDTRLLLCAGTLSTSYTLSFLVFRSPYEAWGVFFTLRDLGWELCRCHRSGREGTDSCAHLPNHSVSLREHTASLLSLWLPERCMCHVRSQRGKLTTLLQTFPFSCPKIRKTKFSPSLARDIQGLRSNQGFYIPQSLRMKAGAGNSSLSLGCFLSK